MSDTLDLTINLIERASVTPKDEGCQAMMAERLAKVGFTTEHLPFEEVKNI
ncbi:MAG: succinyl-diaminopimelate desuccinylase, partial [Methylococcales bacterium]|nr:succinyl-diaminopimelate desuccinylase [Methylococcales bacterium]